MPSDAVNHPGYYNQYQGIEIIDLVEQMNFNKGNAVKYITRAGLKNPETEIQDLEKAAFYLQREIQRLQGDESRFYRKETARDDVVAQPLPEHCPTCKKFWQFSGHDYTLFSPDMVLCKYCGLQFSMEYLSEKQETHEEPVKELSVIHKWALHMIRFCPKCQAEWFSKNFEKFNFYLVMDTESEYPHGVVCNVCDVTFKWANVSIVVREDS